VASGIRAAFDALTDRLEVKPRIHAEVDDMAMLRLVARRHRGLSVLPPIVVQDELEAGTLVEHRRLEGIVESFIALTAPRRMRHPLLQELIG
jgi:LysR family transcriptional activator of nhaA